MAEADSTASTVNNGVNVAALENTGLVDQRVRGRIIELQRLRIEDVEVVAGDAAHDLGPHRVDLGAMCVGQAFHEIEAEMIGVGKEEADKRGVTNIAWRVKRAEDLELPESSVNVALS
jgi:hypothetical protein